MTATDRNTELNPFANKAIGKIPDELGEVELDVDKAVERVLEIYQGLNFDINRYEERKEREKISELELEILTPGQINLLIQKIMSAIPIERINAYETGYFFSRLIQDSYNNGYNGFVFNTQDTQIDGLGYKLQGKGERKLAICFKGDVGEVYGQESKESTITIEGNTGDYLGYYARQSTFTIGGNVGHFCGLNSKETIFKTSNKETFEKMTGMMANGSKRIYTPK